MPWSARNRDCKNAWKAAHAPAVPPVPAAADEAPEQPADAGLPPPPVEPPRLRFGLIEQLERDDAVVAVPTGGGISAAVVRKSAEIGPYRGDISFRDYYRFPWR